MQAKAFCVIIWAVATLVLLSMVVSLRVQNKFLKYELNTLTPEVDLKKSNYGISNFINNLLSNESRKIKALPKKNSSASYDNVIEGTSIDHSDVKAFNIDDSSTTTKRILKENTEEGKKSKNNKRNLQYYYHHNHHHHHHNQYNGNNYYNQNNNNNNRDSRDEDESDSFDSSTDDENELLRTFISSLDSELIGLDDETSKLISLVLDLDDTITIAETGEEIEDRYPLLSTYNRGLEESTTVTKNTPLEMQLNLALVTLTEQRELLSSSNIRISAVNILLRASASDLLSEIQGLRSLVNDLSSNIDDFGKENVELSASVVTFKEQNQILNESNKQYAASNSELSKMTSNLKDSVDDLNSENRFFTERNRDLKKNTIDLRNETNRLVDEVDDLTSQRENLQSAVGDLSIENNKLSASNINLADNVSDLQNEVSRLSNTTSRLEIANNELKTVTGFLDETADSLDTSFEAITSFLSEQIAVYRATVIAQMKNTYLFRLSNWDCSYRDFFGDLDFGDDFNTAIPEDLLENVIEYVSARVLDDLCLNTSDFRAYLYDLYSGSDNNVAVYSDHTRTDLKIELTTNQLVTAVQTYATNAMDYYFPGKDDNEINGEHVGLVEEDWATARYDCQSLAKSKEFSTELLPDGIQLIRYI